jgi:hypothetical protein
LSCHVNYPPLLDPRQAERFAERLKQSIKFNNVLFRSC